MAVIAITGRKGGIGKSTITGNLAAELVALGRSVVVLDTDPQKSLEAWASLGSGGVLRELVEPGDIEHPAAFRAKVQAAASRADRVLIDTPPGFADAALLAALVADLVLLPVGPSPFDILAARDALEVARQARKERGGRKPAVRFVPSKVIGGTTLSEGLPDSLRELGEKVLPAIGHRQVLAKAALEGLTVREYEASSPAAEEFAALAKAVEEVLR